MIRKGQRSVLLSVAQGEFFMDRVSPVVDLRERNTHTHILKAVQRIGESNLKCCQFICVLFQASFLSWFKSIPSVWKEIRVRIISRVLWFDMEFHERFWLFLITRELFITKQRGRGERGFVSSWENCIWSCPTRLRDACMYEPLD